MPLDNDNFNNFSRVGFNKNVEIDGLNRFTKNLEKHFFSEATIRNCSASTDAIHLVVELDCNFGLLETLHHFDKDTWGNFKCQENSFAGALAQLEECNALPIEVEEFSLFLQDTSIVVNRIYDQSISQQLENILTKIDEHYIHFTKGLTEIPFEIYIPVFEDQMENEHTHLMDIKSGNNNEQDYFSFWGLYYYSEDDADVYDLKNQCIIEGNLQMLNR